LATAFAAAKPYNAHVEALFVRADPRLSLPYGAVPISPDVVQAIIDSAEEANRVASTAARAALKVAAGIAGVEILNRPRKAEAVTCSFKEMEGRFERCASAAARLSDLVVFNPAAIAHNPDLADAFLETLIKTERPVLLAEQAPKAFPGKTVIAWDGSDTAARALVAAIPVLKKANEISLLCCCDGDQAKIGTRDAEQYLALHGLSCTNRMIDVDKRTVGEALLASAHENSGDLMVMGGFGHSRFGEAIFGGVTQHIRWHATLPVVMVH